MGYFISGIFVVLQMLISIYVYILLLRFILQKVGASYFNPAIQILVKLTDWVVKPLRKVVPSVRGYDLGILLLVIVLQVLIVLFMLAFFVKGSGGVGGLVLATVGELGKKILNVYLFAIIIQAIASWIPSFAHNSAMEPIYLLCEPVLSRARRMIPTMSGIDFSPMITIAIIYVLTLVIFNPMVSSGLSMALR